MAGNRYAPTTNPLFEFVLGSAISEVEAMAWFIATMSVGLVLIMVGMTTADA